MKKVRLDELVVEQGLAENVDKARRLIMAGEIRSGDRVWDKAGEKISPETCLELKGHPCRWVSRGGLKLERALETFGINPSGLRCLDIGASTGGFTHVLLESNAAAVVALDVGYGLLDSRIAGDPRLTVRDRTNFRLVENADLGDPFDLIVTDVSFISLRLILPKASQILKPDGEIIALIKPQFEAPRGLVPQGGVITDPKTHLLVVVELADYISENSPLKLLELEPVPLVSRKKNIEFVSLWKTAGKSLSKTEIEQKIETAHRR
ncbi:MAG: TlyA family rRNA (cytidine-2'-O)-methyltransferase [Candidatus Rifleibacteriota bacterium]